MVSVGASLKVTWTQHGSVHMRARLSILYFVLDFSIKDASALGEYKLRFLVERDAKEPSNVLSGFRASTPLNQPSILDDRRVGN